MKNLRELIKITSTHRPSQDRDSEHSEAKHRKQFFLILEKLIPGFNRKYLKKSVHDFLHFLQN